MQVGNATINVNNESIELDVPPMLVDGRTLVPARAVAESFGINVEWEGATQTVVLTTGPIIAVTPTPPTGGALTFNDLRNPENYWVEIDGTRFSIGMTPEDLIDHGFTLNERDAESMSNTISANQFAVLLFREYGIHVNTWAPRTPTNIMSVNVYSPAEESILIAEGTIFNISVTSMMANNFEKDFVFPGGIRLGATTMDDVLAMFGEPQRRFDHPALTTFNFRPFEGPDRNPGDPWFQSGFEFTVDTETEILRDIRMIFRSR